MSKYISIDKVLGELGLNHNDYVYIDKNETAERIRKIPSIDIEPKQGEWIEHEHGFWTFVNDKGERDGWIPDYECNLCGSRAWKFKTNFCPNCGARMKGADDE